MTEFAGIDISALRAHVAILDDSARIAEVGVWATTDLEALANRLATCEVVAIDSPDRWSSGFLPAHADLSTKFIGARCAEFELARAHRIWVPWVTPSEPPSDDGGGRYTWIRRGIELFRRLDSRTLTVEVYPHAIFRRLAGGSSLPPKSGLEGMTARIGLLRAEGIDDRHLEMWSHDGMDALAAGLVALNRGRGSAERVSCEHDGSAMWLPALRPHQV